VIPAKRIAVIDVETTGLSPLRYDRIVEIAVVLMSSDGTIHLEYDTLVNPRRDIGASSIHRITASDVLHAPAFADVGGDLLQIIAGADVIAGHNIGFDRNFLIKEYERLGVTLPELPMLCTCRLFGRASLQACCEEFEIPRIGEPHCAISDARATAHLVRMALDESPTLLDAVRVEGVKWPSLQALSTPCFRRQNAKHAETQPPRFLQRLASRMHHDVDAEEPHVLAYMTLIDRILEDRAIDQDEEDALVDAATSWMLSPAQLKAAHEHYLHKLVVCVLADGVVSDSERRDLHLVARLLGQDPVTLDKILKNAASQLKTAMATVPGSKAQGGAIRGQRVCFTGELGATIGGELITRELAETLAGKAGLVVANNVTKKLDILVVADPNTQSSKAKRAREYGIRIVADSVFWQMAGIEVD
jgi:DNA polymerase-3 subunit epsilon